MWLRSCSMCYGMYSFRVHRVYGGVQTCDYVHFQSARDMDCLGIHTLARCPNLWLRSCSKCYGMDSFGTYFTHVQTCDYVRVQSATEWAPSVHTLHMSKPVITFVFKVLRNGHTAQPFRVYRRGPWPRVQMRPLTACADEAVPAKKSCNHTKN